MVNINISAGDDYPSGWRKANYSGGVFCTVDVGNDVQVCSSASSSTNRRSYQNVCGMARGLSEKYNNCFQWFSSSIILYDSPYMLQDYQLLMVIHINTYGHMPLEDMIIKPYTILSTILFVHVLIGVVRVDHLPLLM